MAGCAILVDEVTVSELVENETVRQKYQYLIAKAFVAGNKHIQWCPAPGCENAVKVDLAVAKPIHCECGTLYWCVLCLCEKLFLIDRPRSCLTRLLLHTTQFRMPTELARAHQVRDAGAVDQEM
jgi:hypothetical protein